MARSQSTTFLGALAYILTFLKFSLAEDTLSANQIIRDGQTLVSQGQRFELGFFSPGKLNGRFLGIWYKTTPDVVVWVANRNQPITDSQGILNISRNGTLVLSRGQRIIWSSSNLSRVASSPVLRLLDTGNLVLIDKTNGTSPQNYMWQSFDYPGDTRLPGMAIVDSPGTEQDKYLTSWRSTDDPSLGDFTYRVENHDLVELVIYSKQVKRCRSGPWNGHYFSNLPFFPTVPFKPNLVINTDRVSVSDNSSFITRLTLDESGFLQRYMMNEGKNEWNLVMTIPRDSCDNYGQCGPNAICKINKVPICECLKGFSPKSQQDWDVQDWSSGCTRIRPLNCQNGDGFLRVGANFPDRLQSRLNINMSFDVCQAQCSKSCSCTAYATPFIGDGVIGCLMWYGDLIDIREVPGADSTLNFYIRLPLSELVVESDDDSDKKKKKPGKLIFISTAVGVLISLIILGAILLKIRLMRQGKRKTEDLDLPSFDLATIAAATDNFSTENMIGEGGFGQVYRGSSPDGQEIAVKRLSKTSTQGLEEFKNEVSLIAKLQHRNLVRLLGCCTEGDEIMLIYEYMQNKSLDNFIFDQESRTILTWPKRFDIIMGISRGLLYLHHDSRLKIIHRDLKTSNILLDENLNPKISDFGLARILGGGQGIARTKRVIGTYGYMAPEYTIDGKFSVKSDVFSMGVVLLEMVSGKRNRGFRHLDHYHSLLGHAWLLWNEDKALELMDECFTDSFVECQVKRCIHVGLLCVQKHAEDRPVMSSVIFMLGSEEGAILPEPKEPGFFIERSSFNEKTCTLEANTYTISITDLEGR